MRVIIDECMAGMANGELLARIQGSFDAFITIDQNIAAQQTTAKLSIGVIVLRAPSNKFDDVKPLVPQILKALSSLQPGQIAVCHDPKLKGP